VVLSIFFLGINPKTKKLILAKIIREAYLTNNLVVKLLISIDIIILEEIDLITSKRIGYIGSYRVEIKIKVYYKKRISKLLVYIIATLIIPLFTLLVISIYYAIDIKDRDLLFELDETLVILFI
jgi:hypothetical protein